MFVCLLGADLTEIFLASWISDVPSFDSEDQLCRGKNKALCKLFISARSSVYFSVQTSGFSEHLDSNANESPIAK